MSVRSRCLAYLLALLAAAGASRAQDPPPPSPEPRAPRPPAFDPPSSDAIEQYRALRAAYEAERWQEVLDRVAACFHPSIGPSTRRRAVAMAATAAHRLEMWETCVQYSVAYAGLNNSVRPRTDDEDWTRALVWMEAEALLRLDRPREAGTRLDEAAARFPDLRENEHWRIERLAARPGDGVVFDLGSVAPSDARAIEEGRLRLERAIAPAIDHLKRRLGQNELRVPPIRFLVIEAGDFMGATVVARGAGGVGIIRVRVEVLLQPTMTDEFLLAHEIAHLIHRGGAGHGRAPFWLREGLAEWLEARDDTWLREAVVELWLDSTGAAASSMSSLLESEAALEAADDWSQRVGGTEIFFQVEKLLGRTAMQGLVGRLLKEGDHASILKEATGLPTPRLFERVRAGYLERAAALFPGMDAIVTASTLAEQGKTKETLACLDGLPAGTEGNLLRPFADLLRIRTLADAADWPAAVAALGPVRALRRERPLARTVREGVLVEIAVLAGSGNWEGAAALAREARRSMWVLDSEGRAEVEEVLAEAEKHLPVAPAPK